MIKRIQRDVVVMKSVDIVLEVICNKCGKPLKQADMGRDGVRLHGCKQCDLSDIRSRFYGMVEHTEEGCYDSTHLLDCTQYTFSLCEECLVQLMDCFVVPPELFCTIGGESPTWAQDREVWRSMQQERSKYAAEHPPAPAPPTPPGEIPLLQKRIGPINPVLLRAWSSAGPGAPCARCSTALVDGWTGAECPKCSREYMVALGCRCEGTGTCPDCLAAGLKKPERLPKCRPDCSTLCPVCVPDD